MLTTCLEDVRETGDQNIKLIMNFNTKFNRNLMSACAQLVKSYQRKLYHILFVSLLFCNLLVFPFFINTKNRTKQQNKIICDNSILLCVFTETDAF